MKRENGRVVTDSLFPFCQCLSEVLAVRALDVDERCDNDKRIRIGRFASDAHDFLPFGNTTWLDIGCLSAFDLSRRCKELAAHDCRDDEYGTSENRQIGQKLPPRRTA